MSPAELTITYPAVHPGTAKTAVRFYEGNPDLSAIFSETDPSEPRRLFVTDDTVAALPFMASFLSPFTNGRSGRDVRLILHSGEPYKTVESVLSITKTAIENNFNRKDLFVGIGGGVICDMTAFAAAIFKRGAGVELVPTTLLAMTDAAVGGKSGCDFDSYKNMIGAFFPARTIFVCPQFVQSLPDGEYRSGLAEVVKTALLYSEDLYRLIDGNREKVRSRDEKIVNTMISSCVQAKASVVEQDFTEQNIRMQLNYGHTFGHALETVAGLGTVSHGDAVAWGIGRALALSERLGLCLPSYREAVCQTLTAFGWETGPVHSVLAGTGTPEGKLLSAMKKDKKNTGNKIRVILQKKLTDTVIMETADDDIRPLLKA